jgi:ribosomal protein S18 acetylase RimI-like enzyme
MLQTLMLLDPAVAAQLYALQQQAYGQEAALIDYPDLPSLKETPAQLMTLPETILGWFEAGDLLGAIGYARTDRDIEICRLVVSPVAQRRGIGSRLVAAVVQHHDGLATRVSTAAANQPAIALYQRHGFSIESKSATPDGLLLVHLRRLSCLRPSLLPHIR